MQVLLSKGLIKEFRLSAGEAPEKKFLNGYVNSFEEKAAELLKIYIKENWIFIQGNS